MTWRVRRANAVFSRVWGFWDFDSNLSNFTGWFKFAHNFTQKWGTKWGTDKNVWGTVNIAVILYLLKRFSVVEGAEDERYMRGEVQLNFSAAIRRRGCSWMS